MTLALSRVRLAGVLLTLIVAVPMVVRVHGVSVRPVQTVLPALPSDALFNDTVLHEVRLDINARDWQTLKDNYLTNEVLPVRLPVEWPSGAQRRHSFARPGQPQRH